MQITGHIILNNITQQEQFGFATISIIRDVIIKSE